MDKLWQPPRLRRDEDSPHERRATWLELFFDLVFVATIAELGKVLLDDVSLVGFGHYILLFVTVWWCWLGETFYATRFDHDSLSDRLVTLVQMMVLVVMAVNAHHGLDQSAIGFALSYVAFRTILVLQYFVAGLANPAMRGMIRHFCFGFTVSILLWASSIFVTGPLRYGLWMLGLVIDFATPLSGGRYVAKFPPSMSHVPERMGLFTIIVLGESLFAAIGGLSKQDSWTVKATSMAVLGLVNAFSLWWMYFETASGSPLLGMKGGKMRRSLLWLYAHLPLAIGITAVGVGLKYAISKGADVGYLSDGGRWLLCGSMALCLGVMAVIHGLTCDLGRNRRRNLMFHRLIGMGFLLAIGAVGHGLSALTVVGFLALVGVIQILVDVLGQLREAA